MIYHAVACGQPHRGGLPWNMGLSRRGTNLTIYQFLCYPERWQGPDGLHEFGDPAQASGEIGDLGARHLGGLARQMFFSAGVGW